MRLFGNAIENYYGTLSITTPGGGLLAINNAGNVTIGRPASGTALTVGDSTNTVTVASIGEWNISTGIEFSSGTAELWSTSSINIGSSAGSTTLWANGHNAITIATTGAVAITSPVSGSALTVTGNIGNPNILSNGSNPEGLRIATTAANGSYIQIFNSSTFLGFLGAAAQQLTSGAIGDIALVAGSGQQVVLGINTNPYLTLASTGRISTNAPSSTGSGFGNYAVNIAAPTTASASFGFYLKAGTSATDRPFLINNAADSISLLQLLGDGTFSVGQPTTGQAGGLGSVNCASLFIQGAPVYSGIPQNSQSAAYTLVLSDANKHIYHPSADTTARTWTIPANASVAFPIGTAVTFDNDTSAGVITLAITTDTLVWLPSGTTGSRSIAANGQATALKVTATRWHLTGVGIT